MTQRVKIADDGTHMCGVDWGFLNFNKSCKAEVDAFRLKKFKLSESECDAFVRANSTEIQFKITEERLNECACAKTKEHQNYQRVFFIATYALPLSIITFCYLNIVYVLRQSTARVMNNGTKKD